MKKNLAWALLAALTLTACEKESDMSDNGPVELKLTSGIEVQTKVDTQSEQIVSGEVVSVWVDDASATTNKALYQAIQLTADGGGKLTGESMFFPQSGGNVDIYAIHGKFTNDFAENEAFPTGGVEYEVAADQSESGAASYTNSDLLYAKETGVTRRTEAVNLSFYHMLSKIEVAIVAGDGEPVLATTDAVKLNGVALKGTFTPSTTADLTEQNQRANMLTASTTTGNMTLGQEIGTDFGTGVVYNEAIVVPQNMAGKTITFTLADGGTLTYTIGDTEFESGKKYIYHITMNLTGLSVTSKIEPWGNGIGDENGSATM